MTLGPVHRRRDGSRRVLLLGLLGCAAPQDVPAPEDPVVVEPEGPCRVDGVRRIEVPAVHAQRDGAWLVLRYRVVRPAEAGADVPTIVILPGGPGSPAMTLDPRAPFSLGAPPAGARLIVVDARGSGCNRYPPLEAADADVYRTEALARDVLAVLRAEGVDDAVVYAASYGSAQATVLASLAEAEGVPLKRLVVEGALGEAFSGFDPYLEAFSAEWLRTKPLLPPAWVLAFDTEPWPELLQWSRTQWGAFIAQQLILGDYPGEGPILGYWLEGLSAEDEAAQVYVAGFMAAVEAEAPPGVLFRTLACRELWGAWRTGRAIQDGALVATGADVCRDGERRVDPFDARDWPHTVPIVAFHGPHDPTTTDAQLDAFLAAQPHTHRTVITVPPASHAPLTLGLAARGCAPGIWQALLTAPDSLTEVVSACAAGPEVTLQVLPPSP